MENNQSQKTNSIDQDKLQMTTSSVAQPFYSMQEFDTHIEIQRKSLKIKICLKIYKDQNDSKDNFSQNLVCSELSEFYFKEGELDNSSYNHRSFYGVIGLLEINGVIQLWIVTDVEFQGTIDNEKVYKVVSTTFIQLVSTNNQQIIYENDSNQQISELAKLVKECGFQFSQSQDLTRSLQSQHKNMGNKCANNEQIWNYFMQKGKIPVDSEQEQVVNLIQGYFQSQMEQIKGEMVILTLIARRSRLRTGTRFNSRGIDDSGNASNFVETEIILNQSGSEYDQWYSFVQVRGSVPVQWEQTSLNELSVASKQNPPSFEKHFTKMMENYNSVYILNLLKEKSAKENTLSNTYLLAQKGLSIFVKDKVFQGQFDQHNHCVGCDNSVLISFIKDSMKFFIDGSKHFQRRIKKGESLHILIPNEQVIQQEGVIRTNCLDSLDRTNAAQIEIGFYVVCRWLKNLFNLDFQGQTISKEVEVPQLVQHQRDLWSNCANQLSQFQTGSGSTMSAKTRNPSMSSIAQNLDSFSKSSWRYLQNNFLDAGKEEAMKLMLNNFHSQDIVYKIIDSTNSDFDTILQSRFYKDTDNNSIFIISLTPENYQDQE